MKSYIDWIRRNKKVPAFIGRIVTYAGHPYRIAWANNGALTLRSQLRVHPTDPNLDYNPPLSTIETSNQREITRLRGLLYEMTSPGDWLRAGYTTEQYRATVGDFIEQDRALEQHVTVSPDAKARLIAEHGLLEDDFIQTSADQRKPGTRVRSKVQFLDMFSSLDGIEKWMPVGMEGTVEFSAAIPGRRIVKFEDGSWAHYEPEWFEEVEVEQEATE